MVIKFVGGKVSAAPRGVYCIRITVSHKTKLQGTAKISKNNRGDGRKIKEKSIEKKENFDGKHISNRLNRLLYTV